MDGYGLVVEKQAGRKGNGFFLYCFLWPLPQKMHISRTAEQQQQRAMNHMSSAKNTKMIM